MTIPVEESQVTPELLSTLGQAVMDFGFMESVVRTAITTLARHTTVAKALVLPGDAISRNLEVLARLCQARVHPSAQGDWLAAVDDIKTLYEERNRIFHGMFYEHENKLWLSKTKRSKRGQADQHHRIEVEIQMIQALLRRLHDRRRQFMDFIDDYGQGDDGPAHAPSQETHPSLRITASG
ncbi:MAG: hypothetical protein JWR07_4061 [Nevskia sp.]|nr:hypothetical protein [Nevskia sp.]